MLCSSCNKYGTCISILLNHDIKKHLSTEKSFLLQLFCFFFLYIVQNKRIQYTILLNNVAFKKEDMEKHNYAYEFDKKKKKNKCKLIHGFQKLIYQLINHIIMIINKSNA